MSHDPKIKNLSQQANVTVIIINWNGGELLKQCIKKTLQQTYTQKNLLIIDNNSSDSSATKLNNVNVYFSDKNLGFSSGNNLAIQKTNTEFVALLNPDALPDHEWLEKLLDVAQAHPDVSAFGSRQLCKHNPLLLDGIGDSYHISGLVWRNRHAATQTSHDLRPKEIFSPCAAAALYRRSALEEVGFFDDDYFCYVEDVDLGFRLRLAGHKAMYVPEAVVHHVGSGTTGGQHSNFSVYYGHRNLVWTYIKNMPPLIFWSMLPLHIVLNLFTIVWFSLRGQGDTILRAKIDALKGLPKMWKKRQKIQRNRNASTLDIWRVLDKRVIPSRTHRH